MISSAVVKHKSESNSEKVIVTGHGMNSNK